MFEKRYESNFINENKTKVARLERINGEKFRISICGIIDHKYDVEHYIDDKGNNRATIIEVNSLASAMEILKGYTEFDPEIRENKYNKSNYLDIGGEG